jgi:hypothetical protein
MQSVHESSTEISLPENLSPQKTGDRDHPKRRSDVSVRVIEGETVVFDRQAGRVHQLNQTASYIWERCDGTCRVMDLTHQLTQDFDVDRTTAANDVAAIILQLQGLNLLETR